MKTTHCPLTAPKTLAELCEATEKINKFARQFTRSGTCALAAVNAAVEDDNGGPLDVNDVPVGGVRLLVDMEHFRHDGNPDEAEAAESKIADFCKSLGFAVKFESNVGSGQFGKINQLELT